MKAIQAPVINIQRKKIQLKSNLNNLIWGYAYLFLI